MFIEHIMLICFIHQERNIIFDLLVREGEGIVHLSYCIHESSSLKLLRFFRDWSLITGRGGLQNGKIAGPKLFAPPPQDMVKLFVPPLLKSGNFRAPPYNMAKTSSYRVKTIPKLFVPPPSAWLKLFPPPPFHRGQTSRAPPSRFVAPPSP